MKAHAFLLVIFSARCLGGSMRIESSALPDVVDHQILAPAVFETGFYPTHAPSGRYTQAQLDAALAGLAPEEIGILSSTSDHRFTGDLPVSTTTWIDPNGALHGTDFTGDPFDHETWTASGSANLVVDLRLQSRIRRESRDFVDREYVRKPRPPSGPGGQGSTVDISTWSYEQPTDLVESAAPVLKYSPATVPAFIPAALVQQALAGASPGQEVPLTTGYGVLPLGPGYGETVQTVNTYNVEFGVDYIGDPEDYFTWIAIGPSSIQVSVRLITEAGSRFLDQSIQYRLVAPDATGSVIVNPQITVTTEVTDTTRTWDKIYFQPVSVPSEVDSSDAATLAAKLAPGSAALVLHTVVDTPGTATHATTTSIEAHGAVAGVDYSGNPANPATWTALTANDVVADRLETLTHTTPTAAEHRLHTMYREASPDPGQTGQLHIVENNVVGRDIVRVTRRYLNRTLDTNEPLPEGLTAANIQSALAWAAPGEVVIAGQTSVRTLASTQTTPLGDLLDTNGWTLGTDFLGDPGDLQTWHAAGPADIYVDIYHRVTRIRNYDEVVTHHLVTAPAGPSPVPPPLSLFASQAGPPRSLDIGWRPPYGMQFEVETSANLTQFTPVPGLYKADGRELRHTHYFPAAQPVGFLRVKRK